MIQISDESPPPGSNETDTEQLDAVQLNDLASEVKMKNLLWDFSFLFDFAELLLMD